MKGFSKKNIIFGGAFMAFLTLSSCLFAVDKTASLKASNKIGKPVAQANPISANVFCADPTSIEYQGRLYVYGTNDHQQYLNAESNSYEKIKSLVIFSTDDMVNWTYHGQINVGKIAPWIMNSWAPSIVSRIEDDGLTHFYLYFSNSGMGVGVITATNPLGPWTDPRGSALVYAGMEGLDSPNPFDPGVVIDDFGNGWMAFGGGVVPGHDDANPGSAKLVKLGKDMISLDGKFVDLNAPYFFEASEMNYINGTYVYTFNHNWQKNPGQCSMAYMTSNAPEVSASWKYKGYYFKNPGEMGFDYGNNHTHLQKYQGKWYLFFHTQSLCHNLNIKGGFRSLCVNEIKVDEENVVIKSCTGSHKGVSAIKNFNPFQEVSGSLSYTNAEMSYKNEESPKEIYAYATNSGSWFMVKNVDFADGASKILAQTEGTGSIEIRLDSVKKKNAAIMELNSSGTSEGSFAEKVTGVHDLYFIFSDKDAAIKNWRAEK